MIKIGREEPVASMDSGGKIIWAKHNEIQTVNIKAVPADFEVCASAGVDNAQYIHAVGAVCVAN